MKTTTYFLVAALLTTTCLFDAQAENSSRGDNNRDKHKTESRKEYKPAEKSKQRDETRARSKDENQRGGDAPAKRYEANNRNQRDERFNDRKQEQNERERRDARFDRRDNDRRWDNDRRDRDRWEKDRRDNDHRYGRPDFDRRYADRGKHYGLRRHEVRCPHCYGHGFTLGMNGRLHISCPYCEGRGIRIIRDIDVCTCAQCYDPLFTEDVALGYSIEELAWLETNRLVVALHLSDSQAESIFAINFNYLTDRHRHHYWEPNRRDREIRAVLRMGQIASFILYLNNLANDDLCDHCRR